MLPILGEHVEEQGNQSIFRNEDISVMGLCIESGELDIFEEKNFQDFIEYRYTTFARKLHLIGCLMHFLYVATVGVYIH